MATEKSTPNVEIPTKTCDEKRIEKLKLKYNKAKELLSHSEGHLQIVIYRMEQCYQEQVKAEEELMLAQIKYKNSKKESQNLSRELRYMRNVVRQNKMQKSGALYRCTAAIKENNMKIQVKLFNASQEVERLERLERIETSGTLNLELLRSKVPDEVLKIIASYIPYKTRIEMIEHFHKPQNYLRCLSSDRLHELLRNMNYASYYCLTRVLASNKEVNLLRYEKSMPICETFRKEEKITKIKFILMILKKKDPECALRVLKVFTILNQANIANKCKITNKIFFLDLKQDAGFMTHAC